MGGVDVVWVEMRRRSPGSRRRVEVVSTRRGKSGREAEKEKKARASEARGTAPTFIALSALGEGPC